MQRVKIICDISPEQNLPLLSESLWAEDMGDDLYKLSNTRTLLRLGTTVTAFFTFTPCTMTEVCTRLWWQYLRKVKKRMKNCAPFCARTLITHGSLASKRYMPFVAQLSF